ncbi:MAG: hypothetical protein ACREJV_10010 [Candidatus Rokuibacteriota bacterium]
MRRLAGFLVTGLVIASAAGPPAFAQSFNSGSTGADGAFSPAANTTLTVPPDGVFNFTTINIPAGVVVTFTRNVANTPVTLLASGNVTIAGTINIAGATGGSPAFSTTVGGNGGRGGPGGFDGGAGATGFISVTGGSGLGPGGGAGSTAVAANHVVPGAGGAGHLTAGATGLQGGGQGTVGAGGGLYGTASLLPVVGGSGGGGGGAVAGRTGGGGGGGGGALVIASSGTITMSGSGSILAQGGNALSTLNQGGIGNAGGGSGGSVRLVATSITGTGTINVAGGGGGGGIAGGGAGSAGRVRVEAFSNTISVTVGALPPGAVTAAAPSPVTLANNPTLRISSVGGVAAPAAPSGSFTIADVVLPAGTTNPVTVNLQAANIPLGTTVTVSVKGQYGAGSATTSGPLTGTLTASTASASVTVPTDEPSVISASASFLLTALGPSGPVYAEGEEVERVRVTVTAGGDSRVAYITKSGREIALGAR